MYNLTNVTDANNAYGIITAVNDLSGGLLIVMFILVLFLGYIYIFKKGDFKKVLLGGSFFMIIITAICWAKGWIGWTYIIIPVIIFGASLVAYQFIE